jgi:hypothetical protein
VLPQVSYYYMFLQQYTFIVLKFVQQKIVNVLISIPAGGGRNLQELNLQKERTYLDIFLPPNKLNKKIHLHILIFFSLKINWIGMKPSDISLPPNKLNKNET